MLYRVRRAALRASTWMFKRVLDLAVAGAVLGLSAPILGLVALAVKATNPGPILFRQRRVGQDGNEFELLKFRTLRRNNQGDTQSSRDWLCAAHADRAAPPSHEPRRIASVVERNARRHVVDRGPTRTTVLRGPLQRRHRGLQGPASPSCRTHRVGAGERLARRHLDRSAGTLRQPLHRELVDMARLRHSRAHRGRGGARRQRSWSLDSAGFACSSGHGPGRYRSVFGARGDGGVDGSGKRAVVRNLVHIKVRLGSGAIDKDSTGGSSTTTTAEGQW